MHKKILLCGNPNVGKSSIFNLLTISHEHTGNWTGKTVSVVSKKIKKKDYILVDLPGIYSLSSLSEEENITKNVLLFDDYEKIIYVADACNLERNLNLLLQILEINKNIILCINMIDELDSKNIKIDFNRLSEILNIPVVTCSCKNKKGIDKLLSMLDSSQESTYSYIYNECIENKIMELQNLVIAPFNERGIITKLLQKDTNIIDEIFKRYNTNIFSDELKNYLNNLCDNITYEISIKINEISREIYRKIVINNYKKEIKKFDIIFSSKIYAIPLILLIMFIIFYITIILSNYPSELLTLLFNKIENVLLYLSIKINIPNIIYEPIIFGIYRIVSFVISVMLPPLIIFFILFTYAEESGILPRIAFNFDKIFNKCNCHGKQSLTMCTGFGCNACAVAGARIIDSDRDKKIAILTNSFIPCNGRFPMIIALVSMFFVNINNKLLVSLYVTLFVLFGIIISLIVSLILSKTLLKGYPGFFILELPDYKRVNIKKVLKESINYKALSIIKKAILISAPSGLIIWLLTNININNLSLFNYLAKSLDYFSNIFGMDGIIFSSFILGFPANEIVLPIMLMGYLNNSNVTVINNLNIIKNILINNGWTMITATSVILFSIMHFPCATTLYTIKRELGTKWAIYAFFIPLITGLIILFIFNYVIKTL